MNVIHLAYIVFISFLFILEFGTFDDISFIAYKLTKKVKVQLQKYKLKLISKLSSRRWYKKS